MHELTALGFGPFFEKQVSAPDSTLARIAAEHRGGYDVWSNAGDGHARLAGRLVRELQAEAFPGVGDWVELKSAPGPGQTAIIESVLRRRTVFIRGAAGRQARAQVVAANIDLVFVVCGLDEDYNLRRVERYLARVWASGAEPVVILNKADLSDAVAERVAEVQAVALGVPVVATSAIASEGLEIIQSHVRPGETTVFVGSSGAGKSTLINALAGETQMATREVRASDGRGQHTTTHRQLILLRCGGLLIDTPGMRELQLLDEDGLEAVFADIEELARRCRFTDCDHQTAPGCAVLATIEAGQMSGERLAHYLKLEKEARANEVRRDKGLRRKAGKVLAKHISAHGARARRRKGGE